LSKNQDSYTPGLNLSCSYVKTLKTLSASSEHLKSARQIQATLHLQRICLFKSTAFLCHLPLLCLW
jgi:hypothetical protein